MLQAYFRFYGDLNDFLPVSLRNTLIAYPLDGGEAVKHPIEALGVPHPEVDLILANGASVGFGYTVCSGDWFSVHPQGGRPKPWRAMRLRPPLPRPIRFVIDTHLGQLASYLRLFGVDALYRNDYDDATLARISSEQNRVLLTRDRGLLKRKLVIHGMCVRQSEPRCQLVSVLQRYDLHGEIEPWQRCVRCNGPLAPVAKAEVWEHLEPKTQRYYDDFCRCQSCGQIYWQGSHYAKMQRFIDSVLAEVKSKTA